MKFSEAWLREWVNPSFDTEELVRQLTMAGLEVDSVESVADDFSGVVVGKVLDVQPHPNADKLRVCRVDAGVGDPLQIVCGAANVQAGMLAPTALIGAQLPGGLKIKKSKLRGEESFGMLSAASELGMAEKSEGLMSLPEDSPVGQDIRAFLNLDDRSIDVDLTPNRGDCLSVAGIAREVGVISRSPVQPVSAAELIATIDERFPIEVQAREACPRYLGRVIRGIDPTAKTPLWMRERLRRSGLRSLGPAVDVTNYLLLELGQPMHAFDLAKLSEAIVVREAGDGEALELLDGQTVGLRAGTLVIADREKPVAMAGVMGGEQTAVSDGTQDLFLECAFFSPQAIAGKARSYGLHTDSSHRFERGVDPELQPRAMERATALILEIMGGQAGPVVEVVSSENLPQRPLIALRRDRIRRLLGVEIPDAEVQDILARLGCRLESTGQGWQVVAPSYRFDLSLEADLIEELGRIHGYERLPESNLYGDLAIRPMTETKVPLDALRGALVDRGYQEAITYSFVDPALQQRLDPQASSIALANPLSSELSVMRTSLWPGLVQALIHNRNRQQSRVRLFETGLHFRVDEAGETHQEPAIAAAVVGSAQPEQWGEASRGVDFYDIKGDVEALLAAGGDADAYRFEAASHPALHPGQCARIFKGELAVGWLGLLHPEQEKALGLGANVFLFQLELGPLVEGAIPRFQPLSPFPSIRRDLAVVADEAISAARIRQTIARACGDVLQRLEVFDVYRGKGVEDGRKSLALGLILQDYSRTLTDSDGDSIVASVVQALAQDLGATLRD